MSQPVAVQHSAASKSGSDSGLAESTQVGAVASAGKDQHGVSAQSSSPSTAATPSQSKTMPGHTSANVGLTDLEWIQLLNPKLSTRSGQFPFYWGIAIREFLTHLMHPIGTPFVYTYIWARKGKARADIWAHNHSFQCPPLSRPLFALHNIRINMTSLLAFAFINIIMHAFAILPMILAFLRVYKLSSSLESTISQDYTHEAYFLFIIRAAWCAVVGIKYGFYSKHLAKHLREHITDSSLISSEQLLMNFNPDLARLMFELHVVTAHFPCFRNFKFSISKKHPVARYLQRCKQVRDEPLCNLKPTVIALVMKSLPHNNFHKLFWDKPPSAIGADIQSSIAVVESYSKNMISLDFSEFILDCSSKNCKATARLPSNPHSEPLSGAATLNSAGSATQTSDALAQTSALLSDHDRVDAQPSNAPLLRPVSVESGDVDGSSKYEDVPAFVLMSYVVSRANGFGETWIRPSWTSSRIYYITFFMAASFYAIPGVMRVSQVHVVI